jgi:glycosyltransferase involved in cell wall biosynthesis
MKVSLIMPVRNEEESAAETLDSLFEQVRKPDEIVIADGCSTDRTVAIIDSYRDRGIPIRIVRNEKVNVPAGRNVAIAAACHPLIAAADFGNILDRHWLEEIVKPLEEDSTVDVVAGRTRPRARNLFETCVASVLYFRRYDVDRLSPEEIERRIPRKILFSCNSVAFRKETWERAGGFPEWIRWGEDKFFARKTHHVGARVVGALKAVVYTHIRSSLRDLFRQFYFYSKGNVQARQVSPNVFKLGARYLLALALFFLGFVHPAFWALLALAIALRLYRSGLKPFLTINKGLPDYRVWFLVPAVLLTHDVSVLSGHLVGYYEWLTEPLYRRKYAEYMDPRTSPTGGA